MATTKLTIQRYSSFVWSRTKFIED